MLLIRNQFIRNLVLDGLKFERLVELQGRSREASEISVPSFTFSETQFFSKDLMLSTAVSFISLEANKPCGHCKRLCFYGLFSFSLQFSSIN